MLDMALLAEEIAAIVADEVERANATLVAENKSLRSRVEALEGVDVVALAVAQLPAIVAAEVKGAVEALPPPKDGASVTVGDVAPLIADQVREAVAALPAPKDGVSVTIDDIAPIIADQVKVAVEALPAPKDGVSVTLDDVAPMIAEQVKEAVSAMPAPKDGVSVTLDDVAPLIADQVRKSVAALPAPKDGASVTVSDVEPLIAEQVQRAVTALLAQKDSASVTIDDIAPMIAEQVKEAVSALPAPKDGVSVTLDDVAPLIADQVKATINAMPAPKDGKDGADIADMLIDREGNLVAALSDGRMKSLGQVVGKDGIPFGIDDIDMTLMEDGRTVRMAFTKGDTEYAFQIPFPVILDRGVFAEGKIYEEGDGVTWGGSFWIAQRATGAKPDSAESGWRLAVKRGRDGKDKV